MYYRCTNCGKVYYSAARLEGEMLTCEECSAKVTPVENYDPKTLQNSNNEKKLDNVHRLHEC
ncbi:MAG: hypothetical protein ACK4E2_08360 [Pseudothermotoga sp.]